MCSRLLDKSQKITSQGALRAGLGPPHRAKAQRPHVLVLGVAGTDLDDHSGTDRNSQVVALAVRLSSAPPSGDKNLGLPNSERVREFVAGIL